MGGKLLVTLCQHAKACATALVPYTPKQFLHYVVRLTYLCNASHLGMLFAVYGVQGWPAAVLLPEQ